MRTPTTLAIIGLGPRGLYALECLLAELKTVSADYLPKILLFEASDHPGSGPVYAPNQASTNWININERILDLPTRPASQLGDCLLPAFPSYHEWTGKDYSAIAEDTADVFPPRAYVGEYLQARFQSLYQSLEPLSVLRLQREAINNIAPNDEQFQLISSSGRTYVADEVLLTIGHQPIIFDTQLQDWSTHADLYAAARFFPEPYPLQPILRALGTQPSTSIGLRGFGLSMIDVVRAIAEKAGHFTIVVPESQAVHYELAESWSALKLVPFSLNGLPMVPKPLNARIDNQFAPSSQQLQELSAQLRDKSRQQNAHDECFVIDAMVPLLSDLFDRLNDNNQVVNAATHCAAPIKAWLLDENHRHTLILDQGLSAFKQMQAFVKMATGQAPASLDYAIGQVWRHCQPTLYEALAFNACRDKVVEAIIALDERMKRYAFGPPVEGVQQLIALIQAGVLDLSVVDNPRIELVEEGWKLDSGGTIQTVNVMVNTVLAAPRLASVVSPIVHSLRTHNWIEPVTDGLGARTDEAGFLKTDGEVDIRLAILGRLAKGTLIGVDSIRQCFGEQPKRWAQMVVERMVKKEM